MSYDPHAAQDPTTGSEAEGAPEDTEYLGVLGGGTALYYHESTGSFFEGYRNEPGDGLRLERNEDYEVDADDGLGAVLEEIGDELGWESLSEFAEDHLEGGSDDQ